MLQNHQVTANNKIMERGLQSIKNVFMPAHSIRNFLTSYEIQILEEWQHVAENFFNTQPDIIIYLRTCPRNIMTRFTNRQRPGEENIRYDYINLSHRLYDDWLLFNDSTTVITINGNQPNLDKMKRDFQVVDRPNGQLNHRYVAKKIQKNFATDQMQQLNTTVQYDLSMDNHPITQAKAYAFSKDIAQSRKVAICSVKERLSMPA